MWRKGWISLQFSNRLLNLDNLPERAGDITGSNIIGPVLLLSGNQCFQWGGVAQAESLSNCGVCHQPAVGVEAI